MAALGIAAVITTAHAQERRAKPAAPEQGVASQSTGQGGNAAWETVISQKTPPAPAPPTRAVVQAADLSGNEQKTHFVLGLTQPVEYAAFRLANPSRVVIDIADVDFRLPADAGQTGQGLVSAFRYGLFAPGKSRMVLDTTVPVRVESRLRRIGTGAAAKTRLEIELSPATATELAAVEIAAAAAKAPLPADDPAQEAPKSKRSKPVIVVDPGHGGLDPGARGALGYEKDVVLAIAREVRRALLASKRYDVVMTRSSDVFVSLEDRVGLSRKSGADLFISIHADSLESRDLAQSVRGATVYTLSEQASDERARRLAEKENASDLLAGLDVAGEEGRDEVRHILFDLMRRETANFSIDFRNILLGEMKPKVLLSRDPQRSAAFKVLRQPGAPSVLLELGYISHTEDEKLMASRDWQRGVGDAVARAVDAYFGRRQGSRP